MGKMLLASLLIRYWRTVFSGAGEERGCQEGRDMGARMVLMETAAPSPAGTIIPGIQEERPGPLTAQHPKTAQGDTGRPMKPSAQRPKAALRDTGRPMKPSAWIPHMLPSHLLQSLGDLSLQGKAPVSDQTSFTS